MAEGFPASYIVITKKYKKVLTKRFMRDMIYIQDKEITYDTIRNFS